MHDDEVIVVVEPKRVRAEDEVKEIRLMIEYDPIDVDNEFVIENDVILVV